MKGQKSERFQYLAPVTGSIGPGSYDIDRVSRLAKMVSAKPTSKLGVAVRTACRFPDLKPDGPGAGQYEGITFIDLLEHRSISLGSKPKNTASGYSFINIPGPGTYNPNYAIGRHVGNDHRFALTKSEWLKEKTAANKLTIQNMKDLLKSKESSWEKRTGRRIAHFALYF